jgi:hypothetical protein
VVGLDDHQLAGVAIQSPVESRTSFLRRSARRQPAVQIREHGRTLI